MTAFDWCITITPVLPVAIIAAGVLYAVGKKRLQDRTWKLAMKESNAQFKGYRDTINKLIRDCQDIRDDFRTRTDELDGLVAEYRGQRDAAQAGVVAAHIERDRARAERDDLAVDNQRLINQNFRLARRMDDAEIAGRKTDTERCVLEGQVARLIEENGRLIAASVGGVDAEMATRIAHHIAGAMGRLEAAGSLLPDWIDGGDDDAFPPGPACDECGEDLMECDCGMEDGEDDQ